MRAIPSPSPFLIIMWTQKLMGDTYSQHPILANRSVDKQDLSMNVHGGFIYTNQRIETANAHQPVNE